MSKIRTPRKRSGLGGAGWRPPRPAAAAATRGARGGRWGGRTQRGGIGRNWDALRAAIDAAVHGFGRHEEQVAVDRDVALSTGADERSAELDLGRVIDVVEVDAVIVSDEEMIADKGKVGVDGAGVDRGTASAAATGGRAGRWRGRWRGGGALGSGANPGGFCRLAIFSSPKIASPASNRPGLRPMRGSSGPERGLE